MNIEHLKLFTRIAQTHNISLAGKELGISPAVASAHIGKLEEKLGVRLIHRTTRQVALTEDGHAFLPHAQAVLESVDSAYAAVGMGELCPKGKLRVTAPASFGRLHLLPALDVFLARYADIQIDLNLSDSVVDIVEGGFDVAIRDAALADSSFVAKKLAPVKRVVCASPSYIAEHGEPQTPDDLQHHRCVNLVGLEKWTFANKNGTHSVKTSSVLRVDNGEAVRDAAVGGMGITISAQWCCYQQLQRGELVPILCDYPLVSETAIWALYPSSRMLAPKVRALIDFLATFYDSPCWETPITE